MKFPRNIPLLALCLVFGGLLWQALLQMPPHPGLLASVDHRLEESGVSHGVTAVLLNFRGYDTLFEIGVLLLALISVWSLPDDDAREATPPAGLVKTAYLRVMGPLMLVFAGYLLWIGSRAPGGAFQAGAVLAAVAVLMQVSGHSRGEKRDTVWFRCALAAGFLVFTLVAFGCVLRGAAVLEYPAGKAGGWILAIESAGMVSIGLVLAELFRGHAPAILQPGRRK